MSPWETCSKRAAAVRALLIRDGAQVAVAAFVLHFLQLLHQVVGALLESRIARGDIHQAHGGEVMAANMAGELLAVDRIPAAVALGLGLEPGAQAVAGQHAIRLQGEQVLRVEVLGVLERAAGEADRRQGQGTRGLRDNGSDRRGAGQGRGRGGDESRRNDQPRGEELSQETELHGGEG